MRFILFLFFLLTFVPMKAQSDSLNIKTVFSEMPDSILPYLTRNNRLDMIDFMEAKMKAGVDNLLDGDSEMLFLSHDSLAVWMSDVLIMEMKINQSDSSIILKRTYHISGSMEEIILQRFSLQWHKNSEVTVVSSLLIRDDKIAPEYQF